jgi:hypothetical protein
VFIGISGRGILAIAQSSSVSCAVSAAGMQAALHRVGSGPLLGSAQSSGAPPGAAGGAAGLESCDSGTETVLDFDTLTRNQIRQEPSGQFSCALCWKTPCDAGQLKMHLNSKEHLRRLSNLNYEKDPLAFVPSPHREVTVVLGGWPTCSICKNTKRMDESHWNSAAHERNLKFHLEQQNVLLPQPPPPPEPVSVGYDYDNEAGGVVIAAAYPFVGASSSITSMTSVCVETTSHLLAMLMVSRFEASRCLIALIHETPLQFHAGLLRASFCASLWHRC